MNINAKRKVKIRYSTAPRGGTSFAVIEKHVENVLDHLTQMCSVFIVSDIITILLLILIRLILFYFANLENYRSILNTILILYTRYTR